HRYSRQWGFDDGATAGQLNPMDVAAKAGPAIAAACNREDAGIVFKSNVSQHIKGPVCRRNNGERRGSVAANFCSNDFFYDFLGVGHFLAELLRCELENLSVKESVNAELVTGVGNFAHQPRVFRCDFVQYEECAAHTAIGQVLKDTMGVVDDGTG